MLLFNIIFAVCVLPVWPIVYFVFRNLIKPKKNIIIGVTLPQNEHGNADVRTICTSYLKWLNITMLPQLPIMMIPFFLNSMGAAMTIYMTLMVFVIVIPFIVFAVHHGKLLSLKRENGWYSKAAGKALVDVKAAVKPPKRINSIWFLLPTIISFIPVAYSLLDQTAANPADLWMYLTFALMVVGFWLLYHMIFRVRTEVVNENLSLTMALTRVRRYNWSEFWLVSMWATGLLNIIIWVFSESVILFLTAVLIYTMILLVAAVKAEFSTRIAQQKLTADCMGDAYLDEDDVWLWGMFYNNPNDDHFLVNARIGINMTANIAKTSGKILMIFAVITIAAMPFIGIWVWAEEATPTALVLTDTDLIARHTSNTFIIPLESIETIELLQEMPTVLSKVAGSGFEHLSKGRFLVSNHGTASLCIQSNTPPFIMVIANGVTYFINDANSSITTGIYNEITSLS